MTIKNLNQATLLILILMLIVNTMYRVVRFSESLFTLNHLYELGSYLLIYILGILLLSSQILSKKLPRDFSLLILMAIYTFCIYLISTNILNIRNFDMLNLMGIIIPLIFIYIVNVFLKHKNKSFMLLENKVNYFLLYFGILFILNKHIVPILEHMKRVFLSTPTDIGKYFINVPNESIALVKTLIIFFVYYKIINFIQSKYSTEINKNLILIMVLLLIGAQSFYMFLGYLQTIIFTDLTVIHHWTKYLFIPILLGFYFLSKK